MPQFTFATAELTAEHKRSPVRDLVLNVEMPPQQGADFLHSVQVTGELAMELVNMENRLRLGQMVELKLTAPDGRFTRVTVLLIELKGIDAPAPKQRVYRWAFLVPVKPGHDPHGMFRRPEEPRPEPVCAERLPTPRPATLTNDPAAQEISLGELLVQLGNPAEDTKETRFTSEGGIVTL